LKCYGVTRDEAKERYFLILQYATGGDLRQYIRRTFRANGWTTRILNALEFAKNLQIIHQNELVHRDLHPGNLLKLNKLTRITDLGRAQNLDETLTQSIEEVYGVLPYVAPEVLMGQRYTPSADIYSFGMILWEMTSGKPPFANEPHDTALGQKICCGGRPEIVEGTPQFYIDTMTRCWHHDLTQRPTAQELCDIIQSWNRKNFLYELRAAEETRKITSVSYNTMQAAKTHPLAIYTSRLLPTISLRGK
jgi:serine/threonine protein kinase